MFVYFIVDKSKKKVIKRKNFFAWGTSLHGGATKGLCPLVAPPVQSSPQTLKSPNILHIHTSKKQSLVSLVIVNSLQLSNIGFANTYKIGFANIRKSLSSINSSLNQNGAGFKTPGKVETIQYKLDNYNRSNQDTCLQHRPSVTEGQWVQSGDFLADCAASSGGELALGQNLLIAYMPWEGYNFEDAILISERLVYDDLYTSIHIEKYEMETKETKLGFEEITRNIPDISENDIQHLDANGIALVGSYIEEGDILVGKITPINKKGQSPYQKLLYTILEKEFLPFRDSSLRAPKGIRAKVIKVQVFPEGSILNQTKLPTKSGPKKGKENKQKTAKPNFRSTKTKGAKQLFLLKPSVGQVYVPKRPEASPLGQRPKERQEASREHTLVCQAPLGMQVFNTEGPAYKRANALTSRGAPAPFGHFALYKANTYKIALLDSFSSFKKKTIYQEFSFLNRYTNPPPHSVSIDRIAPQKGKINQDLLVVKSSYNQVLEKPTLTKLSKFLTILEVARLPYFKGTAQSNIAGAKSILSPAPLRAPKPQRGLDLSQRDKWEGAWTGLLANNERKIEKKAIQRESQGPSLIRGAYSPPYIKTDYLTRKTMNYVSKKSLLTILNTLNVGPCPSVGFDNTYHVWPLATHTCLGFSPSIKIGKANFSWTQYRGQCCLINYPITYNLDNQNFVSFIAAPSIADATLKTKMEIQQILGFSQKPYLKKYSKIKIRKKSSVSSIINSVTTKLMELKEKKYVGNQKSDLSHPSVGKANTYKIGKANFSSPQTHISAFFQNVKKFSLSKTNNSTNMPSVGKANTYKIDKANFSQNLLISFYLSNKKMPASVFSPQAAGLQPKLTGPKKRGMVKQKTIKKIIGNVLSKMMPTVLQTQNLKGFAFLGFASKTLKNPDPLGYNQSLSHERQLYSSFSPAGGRSVQKKKTETSPLRASATGQGKNKQKKAVQPPKGNITIQLYLAIKRKVQVGDKLSGRHGNKGIISQILPREDMPFLPDGTPIDMVLNPLGVPSRMNVGQIYECLLGLAGKYLGENFKVFPFDEIYGPEASRSFVYSKLYEASLKTGFHWLFNPNTPGKIRLYDGRTGDCFDQAITVGKAYILRLVHMVDDKIHARSTGPYSLVTQQPLRGRSKQGGQRLGEMEVWALEGYGAAFTLLEMLTIKSDDMTGRMTLWSNLILNKEISIGTPESFKVLVCELQALCLDIGLFRFSNEFRQVGLGKGALAPLVEIENLMNLP